MVTMARDVDISTKIAVARATIFRDCRKISFGHSDKYTSIVGGSALRLKGITCGSQWSFTYSECDNRWSNGKYKMINDDFELRIENGDPSLFEPILSQTTIEDRRSILLIQKAIRKKFGAFDYLEIGSYRGGSLQPLVLDAKCRSICSIDNRPAKVWDDRGWDELYSENSTEGMLKGLERVSERAREIITTIDSQSSQISPDEIKIKPHLMFIDGAHQEKNVLDDWEFCSKLNQSGVIYFHDSQIIYTALIKICDELKKNGTDFIAYNLPDHVFVIERSAPYLADDPEFHLKLRNNYRGYLAGMEGNLFYRNFYTEKSTTMFRNVRDKILRIPKSLKRRLGITSHE